ncbi:MAG: tyrosine-protein phosphatase [Clostridiales bacterium]|nr:tyrosine-protein phosphatase [Clostridiales bacterium]
MKFGKVRIEGTNLVFTRHMHVNTLPCEDIAWAYVDREGAEGGNAKQLVANYLVVITRQGKKYRFDMPRNEARECLYFLKILNPGMSSGFPKGSRLPLQSLPNTRDLGAYSGRNGRRILPGRLLRSGDLYHVSMADTRVLAEDYKIRTVIDFRSEAERRRRPDTGIAGVQYYHLPLIEEEDRDLPEILLSGEVLPDQYMEEYYRNLIGDGYCLKKYAAFLDILLRCRTGAVLWHGSVGKDRTGVACALILCVLGVSEDTIREDYMQSNSYLEEDYRYMCRYLKTGLPENGTLRAGLKDCFRVRDSWLDLVFQEIRKQYGTMERFWRKGLFLTPKAVEELQAKYLI